MYLFHIKNSKLSNRKLEGFCDTLCSLWWILSYSLKIQKEDLSVAGHPLFVVFLKGALELNNQRTVGRNGQVLAEVDLLAGCDDGTFCRFLS